jgi:hypothetical protein
MKSAVLIGMLLTGCATARLAGEPPFVPADTGAVRSVVLEPFFETAEWTTSVKTEMATVMGTNPGFGIGMSSGSAFSHDVAVQRTVTDKPMFAKVPSLADEHRQVLQALQRMRPGWKILSTGAATSLQGPATLVRVIINDSELVESDRYLKNLAFGFGLIILPLQLINISPVHETVRVYGAINRFDLDAQAIPGRYVRYPTQPDFAVNTSNLPAVERRFGLDVAYTEGVLANELPRDGVLLEGFSLKLAAAIVALVEES